MSSLNFVFYRNAEILTNANLQEFEFCNTQNTKICATECLETASCLKTDKWTNEILYSCAVSKRVSLLDAAECVGNKLENYHRIHIKITFNQQVTNDIWGDENILDLLIPLVADFLQWNLERVRPPSITDITTNNNRDIVLYFFSEFENQKIWNLNGSFYNGKTTDELKNVVQEYVKEIENRSVFLDKMKINLKIEVKSSTGWIDVNTFGKADSLVMIWIVSMLVVVCLCTACVCLRKSKK